MTDNEEFAKELSDVLADEIRDRGIEVTVVSEMSDVDRDFPMVPDLIESDYDRGGEGFSENIEMQQVWKTLSETQSSEE
jgi:hypothetical protein